jgi:integrase
MAEGRYLDVKKDYTTTLGEIVEKYQENFKHQSHYQRSKRYYLRDFMVCMGENTLLANIKYVDLETYSNQLRNKITKRGTIRKQASRNREIACIHHLFEKAVSWQMMEKSPFNDGESFFEKEHNKRVRYLDKEEIERLLVECAPLPYLHRVVTCAINTGMDRGVILDLKWEHIHNGIIYTKRKKTGAELKIPVNDEMTAMLKEIRKKQGLSSKYVFTRDGTRIKKIEKGFNAAVKRAKIDDFTFRDLRHTFASHLAMRGRNLKEIQELMGHENIQMTMRYAHLGPEQKKDAVSALNGLTGYVKSDMSKKCQIFETESVRI